MTNYEYQKKEIDAISKIGHDIAVDSNTNQVRDCDDLECEDCLFDTPAVRNTCQANAMRWAASEYKEPGIDWSKVPIDTPVLVSENGADWCYRYFAGVNDDGEPLVYPNGCTSWSNKTSFVPLIEDYNYIELAELPFSPETKE